MYRIRERIKRLEAVTACLDPEAPASSWTPQQQRVLQSDPAARELQWSSEQLWQRVCANYLLTPSALPPDDNPRFREAVLQSMSTDDLRALDEQVRALHARLDQILENA